MTIRWSYNSAGMFTTDLLYWLWGGVDSEYCFASERSSVPELLGTFVGDNRIIVEDIDAGLLDQCDVDTTFTRCIGCRRILRENYSSAKFVVYSKYRESFLGSSFLNGLVICHRRVLMAVETTGLSGARFLSQQKIEAGNRRSASGQWSDENDLSGQHFGEYFLLVGSSWISEAAKVRLDDTDCPVCGETNPYVCSMCGHLTRTCSKCKTSDVFDFDPLPATRPYRFSLDLRDWTGEDIVQSVFGVCVTGRVIEVLRQSGQTCFSFGPLRCDMSNLPARLKSRVIEASRSHDQLDRMTLPFFSPSGDGR
ncbi:MAG: hypothetical protein ACK5E3_15130 [Planctomycetota bacterium]|jgi:hypothetical protein